MTRGELTSAMLTQVELARLKRDTVLLLEDTHALLREARETKAMVFQMWRLCWCCFKCSGNTL